MLLSVLLLSPCELVALALLTAHCSLLTATSSCSSCERPCRTPCRRRTCPSTNPSGCPLSRHSCTCVQSTARVMQQHTTPSGGLAHWRPTRNQTHMLRAEREKTGTSDGKHNRRNALEVCVVQLVVVATASRRVEAVVANLCANNQIELRVPEHGAGRREGCGTTTGVPQCTRVSERGGGEEGEVQG